MGNKYPRVLGLDVSKEKVTACILSEVPRDLKRFHQSHKCPVFEVLEIQSLLDLDFDGVALEPTGIHYARIWVHHLQKLGKPIRWVGHREIRHYREFHKLPNKSDNADAIAIAAYALERWDNPRAFIQGEGEEIRYLYLQLMSLNRIRRPIIARLRLQLAHEFPEVADKLIQRHWLAPPPGILQAIAGAKLSKKWEKEFSQTIGSGLSSFTEGLARMLLEVDQQELVIEKVLAEEIQSPNYRRYVKVLNEFGITDRTAIALLGHIYPIERFLDENGREIIERVQGRKYYRSLAAYKLTLGIGKVQYQSGGELKWKAGGSSECRQALYLWVRASIIMHPDLNNPHVAKLREYFKSPESGKGDQRIMRVVRRLVERLFYALIKK